MNDPAEQLRAVAYIEQQKRRAAAVKARLLLLAGSSAARDRVQSAWEPITNREVELSNGQKID